jgi:hypothetical protein
MLEGTILHVEKKYFAVGLSVGRRVVHFLHAGESTRQLLQQYRVDLGHTEGQ